MKPRAISISEICKGNCGGHRGSWMVFWSYENKVPHPPLH